MSIREGAFSCLTGRKIREYHRKVRKQSMKKRVFDLQLFADGGDGGAGAAGAGANNAGSGDGGQKQSTGGTGSGASYSFEQAEQIANARADRAQKAALADFFKRQGMGEDEITAAIADYKAKKAAQQPNVSAIQKERDDALAELAEMKNMEYLRGKGVKQEDLDYVLFKVNKGVDDKTDFKKSADAFLKENPRFTGKGFKVSTGTTDGGSGQSQNANDVINASIRSAFGR